MEKNPEKINITWMMGPNGFYTLACDYFFIMNDANNFHKSVQKIVQDH